MRRMAASRVSRLHSQEKSEQLLLMTMMKGAHTILYAPVRHYQPRKEARPCWAIVMTLDHRCLSVETHTVFLAIGSHGSYSFPTY